MEERIKINVIIADRRYPMTIFQNEEFAVRNAVKKINTHLKEIESKYDVQDKQDALSMCLLQCASQIEIEHSNKNRQEENLQIQLGNIIKQIQQAI